MAADLRRSLRQCYSALTFSHSLGREPS